MSVMPSCFAPVACKSGKPVRLAMQRLWLAGSVLPAGARLLVRHVFRSREPRPVEVVYSFGLPRDAAMRAFRIAGEGFEASSELKPREEAVRVYEQGIAGGSLSALARQYGDGVVNLTVGNLRPDETVTVWLEILAGVEPRDDGFRFRFPFTLAPSYHAHAKAAVSGGEGELELPFAGFGDVFLPRWREDASGLHEVGFELALPHRLPLAEIGSPSHSIAVRQGDPACARVALAPEKDVPNRDLVLDLRFAESRTHIFAGPDGAGRRSFAAIVPSTEFGSAKESPRRVAILLDRSGSMEGEPIAQARKAIEACLAALAEEDSFGLLAFDDRVEASSPTLLPATRAHREQARAFLGQVDARGGTELAEGVARAARMLERGGDILLLTDGQVMGTEEVLAQARAAGARLFCLGIGAAGQDRFLTLLARETGGVSRSVTPRERVDMAAVDLFASMGRPVASGLKAAATVQPEPPQAVFAGSPVVLYGEAGDGGERIELTWEGGGTSLELPAGDANTGETVRLLRGSRLISDWESRYPAEESLAPAARRKQSRVAARLVELSEAYGLASREMALVAVVKRSGDRPGELPETRVVAVGMPQDVSFDAYFSPTRYAGSVAPPPPQAGKPGPATRFMAASRRAKPDLDRPDFCLASCAEILPSSPPSAPPGEPLLDIAGALEPDGGMSGATSEIRLARTIAALLAFVAGGHSTASGAFRLHVARLADFLRAAAPASPGEGQAVERALAAAASGIAPAGDWLAIALDPGAGWPEVEAALR